MQRVSLTVQCSMTVLNEIRNGAIPGSNPSDGNKRARTEPKMDARKERKTDMTVKLKMVKCYVSHIRLMQTHTMFC